MNINIIFNNYLSNGYSNLNAISKTCQDIILLQINNSNLNKNVTIKGGVVMYGLSNDKRRATRDLDLDAINESATLVINSKEQIVCEKLKSLLRFGIRTTRYKDIFDIYYLINKTDINKDDLLNIMNKLIIEDTVMKENNIHDIIKNLNHTIKNNVFKQSLSDARNNWLDISVDDVIDNVLDYFRFLESVQIS